jgi:hypothetical protein
MASSGARSAGISYLGLTMVFVALSLFDIIDWPWYWVVSPLWIPIAVTAGLWLGWLVIILGAYLVALAVAGAVLLARYVSARARGRLAVRKPRLRVAALRRRPKVYVVTDARKRRR